MSEHPALSDKDANDADLLSNPATRFILFRGDRALLKINPPIQPTLVSPAELADLGIGVREAVLLGIYETGPRLALDIGESESDPPRGAFRSLRSLQEPVDQATWGLLSRALALLAWNRLYTTCPACGAETTLQGGETARVCTNTSCGLDHYPRTDPSVIVRVISGERCLLGRQPRFPAGLMSVIAGFVEPGETLEEAVCREVEEEVGIAVERITYLGSQPWPFPMSLMIAFEAHAKDEKIRVDMDELEAADWYTRERVREELAAGTLLLSSHKSIARWMIDSWLEGRSDVRWPPDRTGEASDSAF